MGQPAKITFTRGNLLDSDAEAIVNTVNCVGVMGRGIALQMRNAFPANFRAYEAACKRGDIRPGRVFTTATDELGNPRYVINFPTKRHWRGKSRLDDIESGLIALVDEVRRLGIHSVALPPLGCGLGGLDWKDVRPRIEEALATLSDVRATVFEPSGTDEAPPRAVTTPPRMTPGRAAIVELMRRYLAGLMDPFVTLLEIHKLAYFLQEAGEPLKLRYAKAPYGPFAENLGHVLRRMDGHLISGYADGGDRPDKQLELVPGALEDATTFLDSHPTTREHARRVSTLVSGYETPFGLELLSTVHWVIQHEAAHDLESAREAVYAWSERKRRFTSDQIDLAFTTLNDKGWIAFPSPARRLV